MTDRYEKMVKASTDPAAKLLAHLNIRLDTQLESPASAPPPVVLAELEQKAAHFDILKMLAIILPPRERVWWACLAARDLVGDTPEKLTPSLKTAEAWVRDPSDENRNAASNTIDVAYADDDTVLCATAVMYCDGKLGTGEMASYPSPAGASELAVFAMNIVALGERPDTFDQYLQTLIDRAVDIGTGGNGRLTLAKQEES